MTKKISVKISSGRNKRRKRAPAKRRKVALRKVVRAEIAKQVENKSKQAFNFDKALYSSAHVNFPDNVVTLGPSAFLAISQGPANGQRVGNSIRTKKLSFKGTIVPLPYAATTNPTPFAQQVKMVLFYDKVDPTAVPFVATNFFQDGATNTGFNNDLVDMWRPMNTDRYRILHTRSYKIGNSSYTGTGSQPAFQFQTNNDFGYNINFNIDVTKYYPKVVKFDENDNDPTTRKVFCLFYMCAASGGANAPTWIPLGVQYMQNYVYEDA